MQEQHPSILDLIGSRRVLRAVFTSFTLSLTYFENYILPKLQAQGCALPRRRRSAFLFVLALPKTIFVRLVKVPVIVVLG